MGCRVIFGDPSYRSSLRKMDLKELVMNVMNDEFLGRFIRFESYRFRVGHWVVMLVGCVACWVEQVGSIDRLLAVAQRLGEDLFFGLIKTPFVVDVLAFLVFVAVVITLVSTQMAWAMNPTRGRGIIPFYRPSWYAYSVLIFASITLYFINQDTAFSHMTWTEFTPYWLTFFASTMLPMLLFNSPQ